MAEPAHEHGGHGHEHGGHGRELGAVALTLVPFLAAGVWNARSFVGCCTGAGLHRSTSGRIYVASFAGAAIAWCMAALPALLLARRGMRRLVPVQVGLFVLALAVVGDDPRNGFGIAVSYGPPGELAFLFSSGWHWFMVLGGAAILMVAAFAIEGGTPALRPPRRDLLSAIAATALSMFVLDALLGWHELDAGLQGWILPAGALVFGVGWDARSPGRALAGFAVLLAMQGELLFRARDALLLPQQWIASWGELGADHLGSIIGTAVLAMLTMPLARRLARHQMRKPVATAWETG